MLNLIDQEGGRNTLVGQREERNGEVVYRFDIRLQGADETVFFNL